jgi:hypothetical protein
MELPVGGSEYVYGIKKKKRVKKMETGSDQLKMVSEAIRQRQSEKERERGREMREKGRGRRRRRGRGAGVQNGALS